MKKTLYLIFAVSVLTACENEIPLENTSPEGILCLNGFLAAGETARNKVTVTLTDKEYPYTVKTKVELRVNGELKETSVGVKDHILKTVFHAGDRVRIDAYDLDSGQHAWAEETAPEAVGNMDVSVEYVKNKPIKDGDKSFEMNCYGVGVSFDRGGGGFYRLAVIDTVSISRFLNSYFDYSTYEDGGLFYETRHYTDSIVSSFLEVTKYYEDNGYNYYYREEPALTSEESTNENTDLMLLDYDIKNGFKIFSDAAFEGERARLKVFTSIVFSTAAEVCELPEYEEYYDTYSYRSEWDLPVYDCTITADLYSISADEYYYLKALNASESEFYDAFSDLTGPMSLPSNVSGGCGCVCVSTLNRVTVNLVDGYRPVPIIAFPEQIDFEHRGGNSPENYQKRVYKIPKPWKIEW